MLSFEILSSRGGAAAARQAHNLEVRGSSPFPATKTNPVATIEPDVIGHEGGAEPPGGALFAWIAIDA
ncbi:hypothetical protein LCGC14_2283500 [marine sediment metagenome]|uniref:Uncharacterized protein n=1 Tax=marine sediment metagenome TaxID=412755 RepID=A0A0F9DFU0_9ZZZZ